jgi:hypothetical protein
MRYARGLSVERGVIVFGLAASSLTVALPAFADAPKGSGKAPAQAAPAPPSSPPAPTAAPAPPPGYSQAEPAPAPPPGYAAPPGALPPPPPPPYAYGYGQPRPRPQSDEAFKEQIRELKRRIKVADENEDEVEKDRLKEELHELNDEYKKYKKENYVRYSSGMMAGGIVLSSLGGVSLFAGLAVSLASRDSTRQVGYGMLVFSALGISAGIPLAVVGARRVPNEALEAKAAPVLTVGPRSVGLRLAF